MESEEVVLLFGCDGGGFAGFGGCAGCWVGSWVEEEEVSYDQALH